MDGTQPLGSGLCKEEPKFSLALLLSHTNAPCSLGVERLMPKGLKKRSLGDRTPKEKEPQASLGLISLFRFGLLAELQNWTHTQLVEAQQAPLGLADVQWRPPATVQWRPAGGVLHVDIDVGMGLAC